MLNVVVLPAPFGPMMPTISYSPTFRLTSCAATRPPNRMVRACVSSTDIGDLHLLHPADGPVPRVPSQPVLHGTDELTDATGQAGQHDQEQHRADDARRPLR